MLAVFLMCSAAGYAAKGDVVVLQYAPMSTYAYVSTDFRPGATYAIDYSEPLTSAEVRPYSRNVASRIDGRRVTFTLPQAGSYVVYLNGFRVALFAEKPESLPSKSIDILSKGVDATGQKNETRKIQAAIDAVAGTGKTLLFPAGIYKTSQLRIVNKKGVKIHLARGAELRFDETTLGTLSTDDRFGVRGDHILFPGRKWTVSRTFFLIDKSSDVQITGYGAINANGYRSRVEAFKTKERDSDGRARCILITRSNDILLEGVMAQDPGTWNTQILLSERVTFRNVKLLNEVEYSPSADDPFNVSRSTLNTDGFDPDSSKDVLIENCFAYCGDDNVAIKSTQYCGLLGDVDRITVRGCVFLTHKSSLKVGTESIAQYMRNITFENNDVLESDRAIALYCYDGSAYDNIRYINNRIERNYPEAKQMIIHIEAKQRMPQCPMGRIDVLIKDTKVLGFFPKGSAIVNRAKDPNNVRVRFENLEIDGRKITDAAAGQITVTNANVTFE